MKKVILLLIAVFALNLATAQTQEITLENINIRPLNLTYLKSVQDKNTPAFVKALESKAARFDITESPIFDREFESYEVVFDAVKKDGADGTIMATYDQDGKIINSVERYKNVSLPKAVREACQAEYPDFKIQKDVYLVSYNHHHKSVKKYYKVQMTKGSKRKQIKIDANGLVL